MFIVVQHHILKIIAILPHYIASSGRVSTLLITGSWNLIKSSSHLLLLFRLTCLGVKQKKVVFEAVRSISLLNLVSLLIFRC